MPQALRGTGLLHGHLLSKTLYGHLVLYRIQSGLRWRGSWFGLLCSGRIRSDLPRRVPPAVRRGCRGRSADSHVCVCGNCWRHSGSFPCYGVSFLFAQTNCLMVAVDTVRHLVAAGYKLRSCGRSLASLVLWWCVAMRYTHGVDRSTAGS